MSRGGRVVRSVVAAAVCAAVPSMAFATKLDKAACADLTTEFNAITGTGIKAEMERGPEWAKANMPPERLQSARRLIELEDQLEFRCGGRGKGKPAEQTATPATGAGNPPPPGIGAAPPNAVQDSSKAAEQPAPQVVPEPPATGQLTTAPAILAPVIKPPVALKPAHVAPAPPTQRTSTGPAVIIPAPAAPVAPAAAAPPVAPPAVKPPATAAVPATPPSAAKPQLPAPVAPTTPPAQTAATPPIEDNAPPAAASIGPTPGGPLPAVKKPGDPASVAKKKNPRRNPSSAYVAPGDVNPFSLPGMR